MALAVFARSLPRAIPRAARGFTGGSVRFFLGIGLSGFPISYFFRLPAIAPGDFVVRLLGAVFVDSVSVSVDGFSPLMIS